MGPDDRIKDFLQKHPYVWLILWIVLVVLELLDRLQLLNELGLDLNFLDNFPSIWSGLVALLSALGFIGLRSAIHNYHPFRKRFIARTGLLILASSTVVATWFQLTELDVFQRVLASLPNPWWLLAAYSLTAITWFVTANYKDKQTSARFSIIVCEFSEGARQDIPQDRTITYWVHNKLREKMTSERVEIIHIDEVVIDPARARELANGRDAEAVLWGVYTKTESHVLLDLRFDVLSPPRYFQEPAERKVQSLPLDDLNQGRLQLYLARDFTAFASFLVGLFEYSDENYDVALAYFHAAEEEIVTDTRNGDGSSFYDYSLSRDIIHLYLGNTYFYQGEYDKSKDHFQLSLEYNPNLAKALHNLGVFAYGEEELPRAQDYFDKAIVSDSELLIAYRNRAFTQFAMGKYQEAENDLIHYLGYEPRDTEAMRLLAECRSALGDHTDAAEKYSLILSFDPSYHIARLLMAKEYFKAKKPEVAVDLLEQLTKHRELAAEANIELANYASHNNKFAQAVEYLTKAIRLEPKNASLLFERGMANYRQKQYVAAAQDFTRFLEQVPDDSRALFYRGKARYEADMYSEATSDFDRFIDRAPEGEKHKGLAARAMVALKTKDYSRAINDFELATQATNEPTTYIRPLAAAHYSYAYQLSERDAHLTDIAAHLKQVKALDGEIWKHALNQEQLREAIQLLNQAKD